MEPFVTDFPAVNIPICFHTCCPNYVRLDCYCYWTWLKPTSAVCLLRHVNSYLHQNIFEAALDVWAIWTAAALLADVTASEGAQGASSSQKVIWKTHIPSSTITFVISQPLTKSSFRTQCMIFNKSTQSFLPKFTRGLSTEIADHKTVTFG